MRQDARALLERLERQDFDYRDFTAVADEIELWPLFQVLLRDRRIVGDREPPAAAALADAKPIDPVSRMHQNVAAEPEPAPSPVAVASASLFAVYGKPEVAEPKPEPGPAQPDLRDFLQRLSSAA